MFVTGTGSGVTVTLIVFFTPFAAVILMTAFPTLPALIEPERSMAATSPGVEEYASVLFVAFSGMIFTVMFFVMPFTIEIPPEISPSLCDEIIMSSTGISGERLFLQDSSKKNAATAAKPINLCFFIIK